MSVRRPCKLSQVASSLLILTPGAWPAPRSINCTTMVRSGVVFFGNDKTPPDQLTQKVKDRLANRIDKRVFVRADARAKFGAVVSVVDNVRAAGVDQLGLLTDQKKTTTGTPPPPATGGQ